MTDESTRYRAAIAAAFPDLSIRSCHFLAAGWDNSVWEVNDDLVFRFPQRAEVAGWLRTEIALLPALAPHLPVPIPQFIHVAEASPTYPYPFVGYLKLPGVPLNDLAATIIQPERLAVQIGVFLTALHRFSIAQAVASGVADASTEMWRAQYVAMRDDIRTLYPRMTLAEQERTERLFAAYFDNPAHFQFTPVLLHRDFGSDHLLLKPQTGDLAAVIDWGDVSIGDPAQDFCGLPAAWLPTLLAHYGGAVDATFTDCVAFYGALGPYHTLLFGLHTGDESFIARGLKELRNTTEPTVPIGQ